MNLSKLYSNIYLLAFKTQYDLCMSFVRVNEFFDNPDFKDRVFALDEFMDYWVKKNKTSCFEYPKRWEAFGLPIRNILKWNAEFGYKLSYNGIRDKESKIIEAIVKGIPINDLKNQYLIGIHREGKKRIQKRLMDHELAHALYFLDPIYRESCKSLVKKLSKKSFDHIKNSLMSVGYDGGDGTVINEAQAYLSTGITQNGHAFGKKYKGFEIVQKDFSKNFLFFKKRLKTN